MNKAPQDKAAKPPTKPDRAAREAAALRANLVKRKDQARRREQEKENPPPEDGPDGEGDDRRETATRSPQRPSA
jgi:hypothetical protein